MAYEFQDEREIVDPAIAALTEEVHQLTGDIGAPFRKEQYTMVLVQFDVLMANPVVEEVAARALECRGEMRILDALGSSLNVLDPDFLKWRLTTPEGQKIGVEGNYALPRPSSVCANAYQLYEMERRIEEAWGQALLAAMRQMPDEEEHHEEIVNDFERTFEHCSDYLRSLLQDTTSAVHLLNLSIIDPTEPSAVYVVCAALLKHPPTDVDTLASIVEHLKQRGIPLSIAAAELLERVYVRFIKGPAAAEVFKRVIAASLVPLSARPFAMLFNSLTEASVVLDAYDLMLDYGIAPEPSTLRILCKQSRMEYAKLHFTTVLQSKTAVAAGESAGAAFGSAKTPSPSPPASQSPPGNRGGGGVNNNSSNTTAAAAAAAHAASRRRDQRSYFAQRIEDMIERDPKVSLLEAMKVIHRAEVEGTSLQGDTYILSALLRHYCRGITPRKYLVLPFTSSLAYRPGVIADDGKTGPGAGSAAAAAVDLEAGAAKKYVMANAFDFGLDGADDELLESDADSRAPQEELVPPPSSASSNNRRSNRPPPRDPIVADSAEEGTYILEVLKAYGSYPDNNILQALSPQFEGRGPQMEIVASAADAFFEGCMAAQGTMEPVNCRILHALGYYYIDNRWRERAHQLLCRLLEMFHAYEVLFHADLCGTEKWFCYFAVIVGTKTGPLDLGIGLFTAALALSDTEIYSKVPVKLTVKRDSSEHVIEVVNELERCGWERNRILCDDALMLEPQERLSAEESHNNNNGGGDGGGGANASNVSSRAGNSHEYREELGKDSIYTSASQGPSSFANAHLVSARPSLATYMYVTLREIGVEKTTLSWLREKLKAARREALTVSGGC